MIDVDFDKNQIVEAIKKCFNNKHVQYLKEKCKNPYGDGHSSNRILEILQDIKIDDKLVVKRLTYWGRISHAKNRYIIVPNL